MIQYFKMVLAVLNTSIVPDRKKKKNPVMWNHESMTCYPSMKGLMSDLAHFSAKYGSNSSFALKLLVTMLISKGCYRCIPCGLSPLSRSWFSIAGVKSR